MQNINPKQTNVVLGEKVRCLWGKDYIYDNIGECKFKISPKSFYQVNNSQTAVLYNIAKNLAEITPSDIVWDMYCGTGTIGQFAAKEAKKQLELKLFRKLLKTQKKMQN